MWAVVPFKGAANAKRRIAAHLSVEERRLFVLAMLDDVLGALTQAAALDGVCLVSRAPEAVDIAKRHAVSLYPDQASDLSAAVVEAGEHLVAEHRACGTFFVPGDLPLITAAEVDMAIDGHTHVTLIPDRYDIGTNGALSSPPNAFEYLFDGKSFNPHRRSAQKAGYEARVVRLPGFGLDIDTIDELHALIAADTRGAAGIYLTQSGIASRLSANL